MFNPDLQNSPQKIGVWWVARLKISSSLENFKILNFFKIWALRVAKWVAGGHFSVFCIFCKTKSGRAKRETAKGRNRTWNAHCRRFSLIFGSLCKSRDLGVADLRRKPQETADFRRKPQISAETGFSHLLSPFGRAPTNPKVRLHGYGYSLFCSRSSHCLEVLV